jgi:hypothetical protein
MSNGSWATYHRDGSVTNCPCLTPEGFRDPEWHGTHPAEPVCNEAGHLVDSSTTIEIMVKAFVQPIQSTRATRLSTEFLVQMFGEVEADDHAGIFPESWDGIELDFTNWSQAGDDYVFYNGRRFLVINANLIPDPDGGDPRHHWECGLRLISTG